METIILASGSKGNALLIKINNGYILLDVGISYLSLKKKMNEINIDVNSIKYVLITHEHSDHVKGLMTFINNHRDVSIYLTRGTFNSLGADLKNQVTNKVIIKQDDEFKLGDVIINTFALSHDALEPVGYVVKFNDKKIVIATDTGYIDETYFNLLSGANVYILESNHSTELLMNSKRQFYLKQRIIGQKGHLSNHEASWLINHFIKDIKETIWVVAHISEDCNTKYEIEKNIVKILDDPSKVRLVYTNQETSEVIKV